MPKKFYITTPIYYVNDLPHIGHLYTTIVADVAARFHRRRGDEVYFLTGTDEHGQKIERAAAANGVTPRQLADRVVSRYHEWWTTLSISHDDFIRTTDERHERGVLELIRRIDAAGDFSLARHEGWYCASCEAYYPEKELLPAHVCPDHRKTCEWQSEENVYFRLARYQQPLLDFYRTHPDFIWPPSRFNEVVAFVESGLRDLSVSRTSITWGIPFPNRPGHVVYVWLDALANYISALGFGGPEDSKYQKYWADPASEKVHLVGKDILRFHAVYWPAFLMSAGLPLPTRIYAHGWWLRDEKKMSKSVGNVVRPDDLVRQFGPDALRYFLMREMVFGADASFSDEAFLERYNADLANGLGNAVSRVAQLCRKAFGATPPEPCDDNDCRRAAAEILPQFTEAFENFDFSRGCEFIQAMLSRIDTYIASHRPWEMLRNAEDKDHRLSHTLYAATEGTRLAAAALAPVLVGASPVAATTLGSPLSGTARDLEWGTLPPGAPLPPSPPLFPRVDVKEFFAMKEKTVPEQPQVTIEEFQRLELKTARILEAAQIPKSKKLMKLQVDLGGETRQIIAGIATRYTPEQLVGKSVVIVANLMPAKLMGEASNGMVLAASLPETGEPVLLGTEEPVPPGTKVK